MADARSIALVCANEVSLWAELQARASVVAQAEPALAPMLHRYVLDRSGFGEGIIQRLAERITPTGQDLPVVLRVLGEAVASDREVLSQMRADIRATLERDPATGKSGRERVAQKMQEADILILLHGCDEWCSEYIPSKFYDYLWAGRPIWAITHRNPQLDQMLRDRGSYLSADGDDEGIANTLEQIWLDWKAKQLITPIYNPIGVDQAVNTILSHLYS